MSERDPLTGKKKESAIEIAQRNTNSYFRLLTIVCHSVSLGLAIHVASNIGSKFPRRDLITNDVDASGNIVGTYTQISRLESPWMQAVSDIVVLTTSVLLLMRDMGMEWALNLLNYKRQGWAGTATSFVHVASYGFTSSISTLILYTFYGGNSFVVACMLVLLSFAAELGKHMTELNMGNKNFIKIIAGLTVLPLIINIVAIIITIISSKADHGLLFIAYLVALGLKVVHEYLHNTDSTFLSWAEKADRRQGHMVLDLAIKGGLAWSVIAHEMIDSGEPKDVADFWPTTLAIVTLVLSAAGLLLVRSSLIAVDPRLMNEAPTGSMEERTRMLQVA